MTEIADMLDPVPPSEVIELFLDELRWTYADLARKTGLSRPMISMIKHNKRKVSPRIAALLGKAFNTTPKYWLNLQSHYDSEMKLVRLLAEMSRNK